MNQITLINAKKTTRKAAYARRRVAFDTVDPKSALAHLVHHIENNHPGAIVSAYMAIRTEIDPMPAMVTLHAKGHKIALPVIQGRARPLLFREWHPDSAMIEGDFGAMIPRGGELVAPDVLITPLIAYDHTGQRLGYGGGFYDRTLQQLRQNGTTHAVGFAFAGQANPDPLPSEKTDQPLDALVTENGVQYFG